MRPMNLWIAHIIAVLLAVATAAADESALESLDRATALADVRASRGVVFVDLYADW
jgi:thiol:disulfide interchange protein